MLGGPRSQALCVPGDRRRTRVPDEARAWAGGPWGGTVPPRPSQVAALRCRSNGLLLTGLYAADTGAVESSPWPGRVSEASGLGRSAGATPLACGWPLLFLVLGRRRNVISGRSCVKVRPRCARCCATLTPAPSDWLRSVRTKNTNCSDQPLNGQGSVAHVFTPPPLETQRPWGAKPPLRVGCSTQPKEKPLESRSLFLVYKELNAGGGNTTCRTRKETS